MVMRMEQLRYLVEVAKTHSVGIAAERLYVTQPAISTAIRNLESEWGVVLFNRSKNGMVLTGIGEIIVQKVQHILDEERAIRELIAHSNDLSEDGPEGFLRVCAIPMINYAFFQRAIPQFTNMYPRVKLSVLDQSPDKVVAAVMEERCDIGLLIADSPMIERYKKESALVLKQLFTEKIYAVANKSFQLGQLHNKQSVSLHDLKNLPLSTTHFSGAEGMLKCNVFDGLTDMNIVLKTNNIELLKSHIVSGESVGILFNSMLASIPEIKELDAIPLNLTYKAEICCVYREDNPNQALSELFLDVLKPAI